MMTSSNANIFHVTGPLVSPHKASDAEFWCFPWSAPDKWVGEQSRRRWFETPSRLSWRHCNDLEFLWMPVTLNGGLYHRTLSIAPKGQYSVEVICQASRDLILESTVGQPTLQFYRKVTANWLWLYPWEEKKSHDQLQEIITKDFQISPIANKQAQSSFHSTSIFVIWFALMWCHAQSQSSDIFTLFAILEDTSIFNCHPTSGIYPQDIVHGAFYNILWVLTCIFTF